MARSIPLGRQPVGSPRLPGSLPRTGGSLAATGIALQTSRGFFGLSNQLLRVVGAEVGKIHEAQTIGQVKLAGVALDSVAQSAQRQVGEAPERLFRSEAGTQGLLEEIGLQIDSNLAAFAEENPLNTDAQLALDHTMPAFRLGLDDSVGIAVAARTREVLRRDADTRASLLVIGARSFADVEATIDAIARDPATRDLYTESEQDALLEKYKRQGYGELLARTYEDDVIEGATMGLKLPDDPEVLDQEFARPERLRAKQILQEHFDLLEGEFGLNTLMADVQFDQVDKIRMSDNPSTIPDVFAESQDALREKQLGYELNRDTIVTVVGEKGADAMDRAFVLVNRVVEEQQNMLELAGAMLEGTAESGGPLHPLSVQAAELAFSMGGWGEKLNKITDPRLYAAELERQVKATRVFTVGHANAIVTGFTNSASPPAQARSAFGFGELHERGDFFIQGPGRGLVGDAMAMQMLMIHNQMDKLNIRPGRATENVFKRTRELKLLDLDAEFTKNHVEGSDAALLGKILKWYIPSSLIPGTQVEELQLPRDMKAAFEELSRLYYSLSNGEIELAQKYAWAQLQTTWAVTTDAGGEPRWAHNPRELIFANGSNQDWQIDQFWEEYDVIVGGVRPPVDEIRLRELENPLDEQGRVAYMVMRVTAGLPSLVETNPQPPPDALGGGPPAPSQVWIWVPDYQTSPDARGAVMEAEKAVNSERIKAGHRDSFQRWFEDMRFKLFERDEDDGTGIPRGGGLDFFGVRRQSAELGGEPLRGQSIEQAKRAEAAFQERVSKSDIEMQELFQQISPEAQLERSMERSREAEESRMRTIRGSLLSRERSEELSKDKRRRTVREIFDSVGLVPSEDFMSFEQFRELLSPDDRIRFTKNELKALGVEWTPWARFAEQDAAEQKLVKQLDITVTPVLTKEAEQRNVVREITQVMRRLGLQPGEDFMSIEELQEQLTPSERKRLSPARLKQLGIKFDPFPKVQQ